MLRLKLERFESALMVLEFVVVAAVVRSAGHIFFSMRLDFLHHRIDTFHHLAELLVEFHVDGLQNDVGLIGEQMLKPALHCGHGALEVAFRCGEEFFKLAPGGGQVGFGHRAFWIVWFVILHGKVGLERVTPLV